MQKANYTNTSTTSGGQGKYPLSTQTLDFIQQQVMILQLLGYIGGSKYILRQPDGTSTGLVFIDGEVLTLAAKPIPSANIRYINVTTKKTDIKADGETYTEARVYRTAALSSTASGESYEYSKFTENAITDQGGRDAGTTRRFDLALRNELHQVCEDRRLCRLWRGSTAHRCGKERAADCLPTRRQ